MITLQDKLEPATTLEWAHYKAPAEVLWLHAESRTLESVDQINPSRGPVTVIPSAVFSIESYQWEGTVGW